MKLLEVSGTVRHLYGSLGVKRLMLLWAVLYYVTGNGVRSNISSGSNSIILHTLLVFEAQTPIMQSNHSAGITHKYLNISYVKVHLHPPYSLMPLCYLTLPNSSNSYSVAQ